MLDLLCDPLRLRRMMTRRDTLRAGFLGLGGLTLTELRPRHAQITDKFTIHRSVSHDRSNHFGIDHTKNFSTRRAGQFR